MKSGQRISPRTIVTQVFGSFCLAAAILASVDYSGHESDPVTKTESHALRKLADGGFSTADTKANTKAAPAVKPLQSELSRSFEQDELNDQNPFVQLSTIEPIQLLLRKGVVHFRRDVYRSPDYQEESGYDMVAYAIEHLDGSRSTVMAYLERTQLTTSRNVGSPDLRIPFVVFSISDKDGVRYSFFRQGQLIEQSELTPAEAQAMMAPRLESGVPFFSVSR